MFKIAEMKGLTPQQRLHRLSTGNPLVDADKLAREVMCSHLSPREKGCEFFFALYKAQSILGAHGHASPAVYVREGKEIESNGRFNLMLKKNAPLFCRTGSWKGSPFRLQPGAEKGIAGSSGATRIQSSR